MPPSPPNDTRYSLHFPSDLLIVKNVFQSEHRSTIQISTTTKNEMLSFTILPVIFVFTIGYLLSTTLPSPNQSWTSIQKLLHLQEQTLHYWVTRIIAALPVARKQWIPTRTLIRPMTLCSSLSCRKRTCLPLIMNLKSDSENML